MTSPLALYQQELNRGDYQPDDVQQSAVTCLDEIYQSLTERMPQPPVTRPGLLARLSGLFGKTSSEDVSPVRGLYMWGGVGRGKTWIMDLFFSLFRVSVNSGCIFTVLCCECIRSWLNYRGTATRY